MDESETQNTEEETSNVNERIIAFVKEHKVLYDKTLRAYKNNNNRNKLWVQLASELGMDAKSLTTRWRSLRDRYVKELKIADLNHRSGAEANDADDSWEFMEHMAFLKEHVAKRKYIDVKGVEDGWKAINKMQVRGAPAIAIVGCLSLAVEIFGEKFDTKQTFKQEVEGKLNYLVSARPTAVNMKLAAEDLISLANALAQDESISVDTMKERFLKAIEDMLDKDIADNMVIGKNGADIILSHIPNGGSVRILTHCNTGSLATAGYGTALGVIRKLHEMNRLEHVYCTETRPYNQGARLTAYELVHDKLPATLILDNMVASLFKSRRVAAVVVGADRVAANGDTANKIGTYQIGVVAKYHDVPFYVAAPFTSIDLKIPSGDRIVIEERPDREMTHVGEHRIAAPGIACWNPAFDVTTADLITGIITEKGVFKPAELKEKVEQIISTNQKL